MKFMFIWIVLALFVSCESSSPLITQLQSLATKPPEPPPAVCSGQCQRNCRNVFSDKTSYEQCYGLGYESARRVDSVYHRMKRGSWSSISSEELLTVINISFEPWIKNAKNSRLSSKEMFIWIAENEDIALLIDQNNEILTEGLSALSNRRNLTAVEEGLAIPLQDGRNFLQMLAWEKNHTGFEKIHQVIMSACESEQRCIEEVYCRNRNFDIVFETITELNLHSDFTGYERFHAGYCS